MLGTPLAASPPGRRVPIFRDARALITGSFRVRGWTWLLSMLWVAIGAGGAIYAIVAFAHPGYSEGFRGMLQWPGEPQPVIDVGVTTEAAWVLLSGPLLVAGFVRLRGWRQGNWHRAAAWAGSWVAGLALLYQSAEWAVAGEVGSRSILSAGEMAICAAWLVLGAAMNWILAVPPACRSKVRRAGKQASVKVG